MCMHACVCTFTRVHKYRQEVRLADKKIKKDRYTLKITLKWMKELKLDLMVHFCDPSMKEADTGRSGIRDRPSLAT